MKLYRGMRLGFSGPLKNNNVVVVNQNLVCQVFSASEPMMEIPLSVDTQSQQYYGVLDTTRFVGIIRLRFVIKLNGTDVIVGNGIKELEILPY